MEFLLSTSPTMTPDESAFFQALGTRIAEQRRVQRLTQTQLGELVGVTQQQIASFETGRRRMPISTLPPLAKALGVTLEELIGEPSKTAKRGPTSKLQQQVAAITQLPHARQQFIIQVIDSMLAQRP